MLCKKPWSLLPVLLYCLPAAGAQDNGARVPPGAAVVWYTSFSIDYVARDVGASGLKKVEFYITTDNGKSWKLYGEDPDAASPMMIRVPGEGIYGFMSVCTDNVGNRERPPVPGTRPDIFVIVDRTPPTAKWLKPDKDELVKPGGILLSWETADAHPAALPVAIEYSTDQGKTWLPLRNRLPAKGKLTVQPPTAAAAALSFRLFVKDAAGNRRLATCPFRMLLDRTAPTVEIMGPRVVGTQEVDIRYRAVDNPGGTGLAQVTLMYTVDNGGQWHEAATDPDLKSPLHFSSPVAGEVGLALVARDKAGNRTPLPAPGTAPTFTISFDTEAPQVAFDPQLPENKQTLRGGSDVVLRWHAVDANIKPNSASIYFSTDNGESWGKPVAEGLAVNGPYTWSVPRQQGDDCRLMVTVEDKFGRRGKALSLPFKIDSIPPRLIPKSVREDRSAGEQRPGTATGTGEPDGRFIPMDNPEAVPGIPGEPGEGARAIPAAALEEAAGNAGSRPQPPRRPTLPTPAGGRTAQPAAPRPRPPVPTPGSRPTTVERTPAAPQPPKQIFPLPPTPGPAVEVTREQPRPAPAPTPPRPGKETRLPPKPATGANVARVPLPPKPTPGPVPATAEPRPGAAAVLQRAHDLAGAGKTEAAVADCRRVIALEPGNARARKLLASLLFADGRYGEAVDAAQAALDLAPDDADAWLVLGNSCLRRARAFDAEYQRRARNNTLDPELPRLIKERERNVLRARRGFSKLIALRPAKKDGYYNLAETAYMQARSADFAYRVLKQGNLRQRNRYYREAVANYNKSMAIGKVNYREAFHLGVSHYRLGQMEEAQRFLERAVEEAGDLVPKEAFWYLAEVHEKRGELQDALRYWDKAAKSFAGDQKHCSTAQHRAALLRRKLRQQ